MVYTHPSIMIVVQVIIIKHRVKVVDDTILIVCLPFLYNDVICY